jgi:hypothetical protein
MEEIAMNDKVDGLIPKKVRVAFAEADKLSWTPFKDTPGFGGVDLPGVECKFFGKPGSGPWFYLLRHEPRTSVPRHRHTGDVFHFILEGEWTIGARTFGPGFMQFEQEGLFYGPITSGDEGSEFLAIYSAEPSFIQPEDEVAAALMSPTYD